MANPPTQEHSTQTDTTNQEASGGAVTVVNEPLSSMTSTDGYPLTTSCDWWTAPQSKSNSKEDRLSSIVNGLWLHQTNTGENGGQTHSLDTWPMQLGVELDFASDMMELFPQL